MTASRAAFGIRVPAGRILDGVIAGAAGTFALEIATYVDMLVRGRPGSDVPAQTAGRLGQVVGLDANGEGSAEHRKTGAGALLGYVDGVATGALDGLTAGAVPCRLAPLVLAGAAMVAGDATPALMGLEPTLAGR